MIRSVLYYLSIIPSPDSFMFIINNVFLCLELFVIIYFQTIISLSNLSLCVINLLLIRFGD